MSKSQLGVTFQERYSNFFKFFNGSNKSIPEIKSFISQNSLKNYSSSYNQIHLNMIDPQNLNILFHIVRKSKSDKECLEKLMLLIEQYNLNYNLLDINRRTLPFYTCVKGYLNSTKYLLEKMNYNIALKDNKGETLFFSAIRSYNIELVKFLDNKYKRWLYMPNNEYSSCIFNIFKKSMKNEGENKIKNLMKFIIEKGFDIEQKNCDNVSFKDLCVSYKVNNYLEDVLKEKNKSKGNNNELKENKNIIKNEEINNRKISKENSNSSDSTSNITNINQIKKKENKDSLIKKDENKINSINSNISSNHIQSSISKPKIKTNGNSKNSIRKEKKKCCLFVHTKKNSLILNKIYQQLSSHEVLKEKYFYKIDDNLKIPSFEKGKINLIKKNLAQEEQEE